MSSRSVIIIAVLACEIICMGVSVRITITPDKTNQEYPDAVKITCEPSEHDNGRWDGTIKHMTIWKDVVNGEGSVRVARKDPGIGVSVDEAMRRKVTVPFGEISKDGQEGILTVTLGKPKAEDSGVYMCVINYAIPSWDELDDRSAAVYWKLETTPTVPDLYCEDDWILYKEGKTCIKDFKTPVKTWQDARSECQKNGGDLIRIEDLNKQMFFGGIHCLVGESVWIGLRRMNTQSDRFAWLDDSSPTNFTFWNTAEPNRAGVEDCVQTWDTSMRWNDKGCNYQYGYACEKPAESNDARNKDLDNLEKDLSKLFGATTHPPV